MSDRVELIDIVDRIIENEGRLTSNESMSLDLAHEQMDEWFAKHDAEVLAASRREPSVRLPRERGEGVLIETDDFPEPSDTDEPDLPNGHAKFSFSDDLWGDPAMTDPEDTAYWQSRGYTVLRRTKAIPAGPWEVVPDAE